MIAPLTTANDARTMRYLSLVLPRPLGKPCVDYSLEASWCSWYAVGRGWARAAKLVPPRAAHKTWWVISCPRRCQHLFVVTELGYRELEIWRAGSAVE